MPVAFSIATSASYFWNADSTVLIFFFSPSVRVNPAGGQRPEGHLGCTITASCGAPAGIFVGNRWQHLKVGCATEPGEARRKLYLYSPANYDTLLCKSPDSDNETAYLAEKSGRAFSKSPPLERAAVSKG
ncbi:MAG TPA: hypothetical protein VMT05_02310 [Terriglobales bacterium]|nr:hypothetical protein [Terriglobales bacterium]